MVQCRPGRLRSHEQSLARGRQSDRRHRRSPAWSTSTPTRAQGAGARVRPRRRRDRHRPRRGPRADQARRGVRRRRSLLPGATWRSPPSRHGCHLLTEKPLADSRENARPIVEAARRAGRIHAVVQNRRYVANVRRIRRFLDSGAIGAPTSIHCDFFVAPHFGGFREEMRARAAARHGDPHLRRGPLHGERRAAKRLLPGVGAEELLVPAGIVGERDLRDGDGRRVHLSRQLVRRRLPHQLGRRWRIVGERGSLVWDGFDEFSRRGRRGRVREGLFDKVEPVAVPPLDPRDRVGGHLGVIQDFVAAIANGTEPGDRAAPTTSRAWPWSSARSKAPKPAAASTITT